jgi:uncharacterized protein (TIGR01777 family)
MKIILAGGSGFIGRFLEKRFNQDGHQVKVLTRNPKKDNDIYWDGETKGEWMKSLKEADVLINMAGKSVDCRYTNRNKQLIYDSRLKSTAILDKVISEIDEPPKLWMNSSTATIYRHAEDRPMDEAKGEIGTGFSVDVATKWERTFFRQELPDTRRVALRTAIVLGKEGGALAPLKRLVQFGLGGKQGSGNQMFSWIHEEDVYRAVCHIIAHTEIEGPINLSSPNPLPNAEMMRSLRRNMNMPMGLPSPKWLLTVGAIFIRTETELVLKSRWVIPPKLQKSGFTFQYQHLDTALRDLIS